MKLKWKKLMTQNHNKGFTLLELVIVMAIITILTAIMIPNINAYSEKYNNSIHNKNMIRIHTATKMANKFNEELDVNKIIKFSEIYNIRIDTEPKAEFYSVSKYDDLDKITVMFQDSRGKIYTYETPFGESITEDFIEDNTPSEDTVIDYTLFFEVFGREITGLTQEGEDYYKGDLIIPKEIDGVKINSIGINAFKMKNISSVKLPEGIVTIKKGSFQQNNLTTVVIPDSVTNIAEGAFFGNLLTGVTLSKNLTTIGQSAFRNNNLKNVIIPQNVNAIQSGAFLENNLTTISFKGSVGTLGLEVFSREQGWKTIRDTKKTGPLSGTWTMTKKANETTLWKAE